MAEIFDYIATFTLVGWQDGFGGGEGMGGVSCSWLMTIKVKILVELWLLTIKFLDDYENPDFEPRLQNHVTLWAYRPPPACKILAKGLTLVFIYKL